MVLQQINSTNLLLLIFILLASFNSQGIAQLDIQFQCNGSSRPSRSFRSNLTRRLPLLQLSLRLKNSKYMMATSGFTPIFYASYHCRGDVNSTRCHDCVSLAMLAARAHCFNTSTEAVVWGDVCMFRYSSQGFNGHRDEFPSAVRYSDTVSTPASVNVTMLEQAVKSTANSIADRLLDPPEVNFATLEANVSNGSDDKIYVMGECTKDLVPEECRVCVHDCASKINWGGNLKMGARVMFPSCSFRYEMYRFYDNYNTAYRIKAAKPRDNPRGSMAPQPSSNQTSAASPPSQTKDDPEVAPHKWKRPPHDEDIAGVGASFAFPELCFMLIGGRRTSKLVNAWRVWNEGSALELVDYVLGDVYSREEVVKCIHIALLCIQEEALRRPQMTWVVAAIRDETNHFPAPTPPNFFNSIRRSASGSCSSTDPGATSSTGGEILTDLQGCAI
ncbi:hypothetical protein V2J09_019322 [Rumex salicifolius]